MSTRSSLDISFEALAERHRRELLVHCLRLDAQAPIGHAYGLMVLTLRDGRVAAITGFPDTGLCRHFGVARALPVDLGAARS